MNLKVSEGEKREIEKNKNSLQKFWFGEWGVESEGAREPVFLVNEFGLAKEIKAISHGQKRRIMWDGILIDKLNNWFGFRSIPSAEKDLKSEKNISFIDIWAKLRKNFFSLSQEELKNLSKWFQELEDNDKCQIIDVLIDCEYFKDAIGSTKYSPIKNNFKLELNKLIELSNKYENNNLPKLSDLLGQKGIVFIRRLSGWETKVGKILDTWIEEELKEELSEEKAEKNSKKINGMRVVKALMSSKQFGDGCQSYLSGETEKEVFWECQIIDSSELREDPQNKHESYLSPKVIDVVKAGSVHETNKKPIYSPSASRQGSLMTGGGWKAFPDNVHEQIKSSFKEDGKWKGVLDISCSNVVSSGGLTFWISIFSDNFPEKMGCWEFYHLLFGKKAVTEKRLCLFEMPKVKSFIKEIHLFGPFMLANWSKGNKFWAKCSTYGK